VSQNHRTRKQFVPFCILARFVISLILSRRRISTGFVNGGSTFARKRLYITQIIYRLQRIANFTKRNTAFMFSYRFYYTFAIFAKSYHTQILWGFLTWLRAMIFETHIRSWRTNVYKFYTSLNLVCAVHSAMRAFIRTAVNPLLTLIIAPILYGIQ